MQVRTCLALVATEPNGRTILSASTPFGYGPADLQSAYGLTAMSAASGAGETVAIVDAFDDPHAESDLAVYRSQYGLPACSTANGCFRKVDQTGGISYPSTDSGWAGEIALDLDMVSAICPNCHILLVEATSDGISNGIYDLDVAENEAAALGATQISNSWGGDEYNGEQSEQNTYFTHPGVAITAGGGDAGYGVVAPAAFQTVTAVGGTTLVRSKNRRGWSERAWSGTGGGCTHYVPKPTWQTDKGCSLRTDVDVAAVADMSTPVSVYDTVGGAGWGAAGGTSASAPIVAAYDALVGPAAASAQYHYTQAALGVYHDITAGSNGRCNVSYLCEAGLGYDGPTGVGSIEGSPPPNVTTGAAGSITPTAATVAGTVNPHGLATTYHFEYGLAANAYTARAPATDASAGGGVSRVQLSAPLAGLVAETTYHYRLDAVSAAGTTLGADRTFTTAPVPLAQGDWVGLVGSQGYSLADWSGDSDLTVLPRRGDPEPGGGQPPPVGEQHG